MSIRDSIYTFAVRRLASIGFRGEGRVWTKDVLVFKPDKIGDFVLATGAIRYVLQRCPGQRVALAVSPTVAPLAAREFPECEILCVPAGREGLMPGGIVNSWLAVRKANARRSYERILSLRHHPTSYEELLLRSFKSRETFAVEATLLGKARARHRERIFSPSSTFAYPLSEEAPHVPLEFEAHRRALSTFFGSPVHEQSILPRLTSFCEKEEDRLLILPFGSAEIRNYPLDDLVEAVGAAVLPENVNVVFCAERCNAELIDTAAKKLSDRVGNRVQTHFPADVAELCRDIARSKCVLAMESAGAHIATALDKRGVFLLGGGHYGFFAPWFRSARQSWISENMACYFCDWECTQSYAKCIRDISASRVGNALRQVWFQS